MIEKELKKGNNVPLLEKAKSYDNIDAKLVAEMARCGDELSIKIFKKVGKMLGRSLSIIIDLFNPERISLAGVYMRHHDLLDKEMYKELKKESLSYSLNVCEIVPAKLNEEVGDYSAICVALNGLKEKKKQ